MNGPEHYREAERLLDNNTYLGGFGASEERKRERTARADVHATLALTAATWDAACLTNPHRAGTRPAPLAEAAAAWDAVTGPTPANATGEG